MPNTPDGVYSRKPWNKDNPGMTWPAEAAYPPQAYIGPFASNQERLLTQALEVGQMSAAEIQEYVRPNLPQIDMFPARYGYETSELGIEDIIDLPSRVQQRVETDFSQTPNTQQSSSRNTLGNSV